MACNAGRIGAKLRGLLDPARGSVNVALQVQREAARRQAASTRIAVLWRAWKHGCQDHPDRTQLDADRGNQTSREAERAPRVHQLQL